jgi:Family of unknown function (DUF6167)
VRRGFWFAAGVASGVYGVFKVKRAVEAFTPDGIAARVASIRRGAEVFADEVATAAREREAELLSELRSHPADDRLLPAAEPRAIPGPRTSPREHTRPRVRTRESVTDGHR